MDPKAYAAYLLIQQIIMNGPGIITKIVEAWTKEDPTAEDFEALTIAIESIRPQDPLGKL